MQIKNVRLSYPHIFQPTRFDENSSLRYSASFHIEKESAEHKAVGEAMKAAAKDKFGAKAEAVYKSIANKDGLPLRDGAETGDDELSGVMILRSSNKNKPTIVDQSRRQLDESSGKPYAGCYVNALIDIYAWDYKGKPQINCTLRGVQFAKDGEAFSGGRPASVDEFDSESDSSDFDDDAF